MDRVVAVGLERQGDHAQAVAILAEIAREPGLVGIAAGLAKTRVPRLMRQSDGS